MFKANSTVQLTLQGGQIDLRSTNGRRFQINADALDGDLEKLGQLVLALSACLAPAPAAPTPHLRSGQDEIDAGAKVTKVNSTKLKPELASLIDDELTDIIGGIL